MEEFIMRLGRYVVAFTFIISGTAQAASTLDFGIISPTAGSLSYGGGVAPLIGSGIDVDNVVGLGTPLNSNVTSICGSCTLDFQTGGSTGGWNFGAGGTISINGTVDFPDATPDITPAATLLSGTFSSATIIDLGGGNFEFQIVGGAFNDTKHPDLLAFYGLPNVEYLAGLNISFSTTANMGDAFASDQVLSGNVVNQPVPIPASVWLFGSGMLGLVGIARRCRG
jgi:hypothetical protein